jgi:hypothetical protein
MANIKVMTKSEFLKAWDLAMQGVANDFMNELVETAPVDTGNLKNQIDLKLLKNGGIISLPYYGYILDQGCAPHIIEARNAKSLHFKMNGKDVFVKSVHHPGTRPTFWIRNPLQSKLPSIIRQNFRRQFS